jgi:hypothetical protein
MIQLYWCRHRPTVVQQIKARQYKPVTKQTGESLSLDGSGIVL